VAGPVTLGRILAITTQADIVQVVPGFLQVDGYTVDLALPTLPRPMELPDS